jgi:hypothetical protein
MLSNDLDNELLSKSHLHSRTRRQRSSRPPKPFGSLIYFAEYELQNQPMQNQVEPP